MTLGDDGPARPRAILFDWDNTLVDNWDVIRGAMNATLAAFGMTPWTRAETRRRVARSARDSFPALFGDRWKDAQDMFYEHFTANHLTELRPVEGAPEMLAELAEQDIWLGVVSNKRGDLLRAEAQHLGWNTYFRRIVGANDAAEDKPAPPPVLAALDGSDLSPGPHVWFVGDGPIDMMCAHNTGCLAVLFEGAPFQASVKAAQGAAETAPDLRIPGHRELAALVHNC